MTEPKQPPLTPEEKGVLRWMEEQTPTYLLEGGRKFLTVEGFRQLSKKMGGIDPELIVNAPTLAAENETLSRLHSLYREALVRIYAKPESASCLARKAIEEGNTIARAALKGEE